MDPVYRTYILSPRHFTRDAMQKLLDRRRSLERYQRGKVIQVNNRMETDYSYTLSEDPGTNFDNNFQPYYTPQEMLAMGVFEGKYVNDCILEFPKSWFTDIHGRLLETFSPEHSDPRKNYFGVKSRLSLQEWQHNEWIPCTLTKVGKKICKEHGVNPNTMQDPDVRGWFQWYCRYYLGRRLDIIDMIQIQRWKQFKRHFAQVIKHCAGHKECRKKQRQALLQWAYQADV